MTIFLNILNIHLARGDGSRSQHGGPDTQRDAVGRSGITGSEGTADRTSRDPYLMFMYLADDRKWNVYTDRITSSRSWGGF